MKKISFIFLFTFLISNHTFACQETSLSYDELALNSKAVYVGGVMSVSIPDLKEEHLHEELNYPNDIHRTDRVITINVFQTLNGESRETLSVSLDWCNGEKAKLGKKAIVYQLEDGWYLKHDDFAISEATAILTTHSNNNFYNIASQ